MSGKINPNLDEGLSGDPKAMELAQLRAMIRKMIEGTGISIWSAADKLGRDQLPTMAASTILNFAYGKTKRPSTWTIKILSAVAGYQMMMVPVGTVVVGGIVLT